MTSQQICVNVDTVNATAFRNKLNSVRSVLMKKIRSVSATFVAIVLSFFASNRQVAAQSAPVLEFGVVGIPGQNLLVASYVNEVVAAVVLNNPSTVGIKVYKIPVNAESYRLGGGQGYTAFLSFDQAGNGGVATAVSAYGHSYYSVVSTTHVFDTLNHPVLIPPGTNAVVYIIARVVGDVGAYGGFYKWFALPGIGGMAATTVNGGPVSVAAVPSSAPYVSVVTSMAYTFEIEPGGQPGKPGNLMFSPGGSYIHDVLPGKVYLVQVVDGLTGKWKNVGMGEAYSLSGSSGGSFSIKVPAKAVAELNYWDIRVVPSGWFYY